ncbi:MAG: YlxR family protein [Oscillospiraceae bacterium]|nr:YlxR family protein [Oscillospiraceae bacterium]
MQAKKVPMRMCTGCGEMKPKRELIRVVKTPEGGFLLDGTGKKSGRGAYLCRNKDCLKSCKKTRRLEKSFSCRIPDEVYERLEKELDGG